MLFLALQRVILEKILSSHITNFNIRCEYELYRHIEGIPITNCTDFVADLFLLCYESDFIWSLSNNNSSDDIHTGKCIRRFAGIYAYCRYFIDRKW